MSGQVIDLGTVRLDRALRRTVELLAGWRGLHFLGCFYVLALLAPGLPWTSVRRD